MKTSNRVSEGAVDDGPRDAVQGDDLRQLARRKLEAPPVAVFRHAAERGHGMKDPVEADVACSRGQGPLALGGGRLAVSPEREARGGQIERLPRLALVPTDVDCGKRARLERGPHPGGESAEEDVDVARRGRSEPPAQSRAAADEAAPFKQFAQLAAAGASIGVAFRNFSRSVGREELVEQGGIDAPADQLPMQIGPGPHVTKCLNRLVLREPVAESGRAQRSHDRVFEPDVQTIGDVSSPLTYAGSYSL